MEIYNKKFMSEIIEHIEKVDKKYRKRIIVNDPHIHHLIRAINIVKKIIKKNKIYITGSRALQFHLPENDKYYSKQQLTYSDFDLYSYNPLQDCLDIVNELHKNKVYPIKVQSGEHDGLYRVFYKFEPIADISFMPKHFYDAIETVNHKGLNYLPLRYLLIGTVSQIVFPVVNNFRLTKIAKSIKYFDIYCCDYKKSSINKSIVPEPMKPSTFDTLYKYCRNNKATIISGNLAYLTNFTTNNNNKANLPYLELLSYNPFKVIADILNILGPDNAKVVKMHRLIYYDVTPDLYIIYKDDRPIVFVFDYSNNCMIYKKIKSHYYCMDIYLEIYYIYIIYVNNIYNIFQNNRISENYLYNIAKTIRRRDIPYSECIGKYMDDFLKVMLDRWEGKEQTFFIYEPAKSIPINDVNNIDNNNNVDSYDIIMDRLNKIYKKGLFDVTEQFTS